MIPPKVVHAAKTEVMFVRIKFFVLLIGCLCQAASAAPPPAFPGAEGTASTATGGRGGRVLYVTNLEDYDPMSEAPVPGSLRWALLEKGPRIVCFRVSGRIYLRMPLRVVEPDITVAGQTAPGAGICVFGKQLTVQADNVILRHLRARMGVWGMRCSLFILNGDQVIADHCSTSWGSDEIFSAMQVLDCPDRLADRITVQWCSIAEALNSNDHPLAALYKGSDGARFTAHHNLYASAGHRLPEIGATETTATDPEGFLFDFRNNTVYNWSAGNGTYGNIEVNAAASRHYEPQLMPSRTRCNWAGNTYLTGPARGAPHAFHLFESTDSAWWHDNTMNGVAPADPYDLIHVCPWYGWEPLQKGKTAPKLQATSTVHQGKAALHIISRATADDGAQSDVRRQLGTSTPGRHTFSAWVRPAAGSPTVRLSLWVRDDEGGRLFKAEAPCPHDRWTQLEGSADLSWSGSIQSASLSLITTGKEDTQDLLIDDLALRKDNGPNLLPNPDFELRERLLSACRRDEAFTFSGHRVHTHSSTQAHELVLRHVGASIRRDPVDAKHIQDVRQRTGGILPNPDAIQWPEYPSDPAPADSDADGMPDWWEAYRHVSDANADRNLDGYTNLEEYLNGLCGLFDDMTLELENMVLEGPAQRKNVADIQSGIAIVCAEKQSVTAATLYHGTSAPQQLQLRAYDAPGGSASIQLFINSQPRHTWILDRDDSAWHDLTWNGPLAYGDEVRLHLQPAGSDTALCDHLSVLGKPGAGPAPDFVAHPQPAVRASEPGWHFIDDQNLSHLIYRGQFDQANEHASGAFMASRSITKRPGDTCRIVFHYPRARLYFVTGTAGEIELRLDDQPAQEITLSAGAQQGRQLIYETPQLPAGEHQITIKLLSGEMSLDAIALEDRLPPSAPRWLLPPSTTQHKTARMIVHSVSTESLEYLFEPLDPAIGASIPRVWQKSPVFECSARTTRFRVKSRDAALNESAWLYQQSDY